MSTPPELDESPFSRWRRLRNDPRFIEAVTAFCAGEEQARYEIAYDYATWWAPNVRTFRLELRVILERDIAVELLIERQGRQQIMEEEDDEAYALEMHWERKQLFAFWPRWVEHAHGLLAARIWTLQSLERLELHRRMVCVDRAEARERIAIQDAILAKVQEVPLEWGAFVPPLVADARESQRRERAEAAARQEEDVAALRALYRRQAEEMQAQRERELLLAWEAGKLRIEWAWEQGFDELFERCFPSQWMDDDEDGDGDDHDHAEFAPPAREGSHVAQPSPGRDDLLFVHYS